MQAVINWLEENNIPYSYVKEWIATEGLPPSIRKVIAGMAQGSDKVQLENNSNAFRVVALYGAYPDPIDPIFAKNSVTHALLDEARNKRVDDIVYNLLSHTNITLYDRSFNDLKVPKFTGAVTQPSAPLTERIYLAWNFALLIFVPVSLYLFFKEDSLALDDYATPTTLETLSFHIFFRLSFVLLAGGVLVAPALNYLGIEYSATTRESYASVAALGLTLGLATVFVLSRIPIAQKAFSSRWVGVSLLFLLQLTTVLMLG